MFYWILLLLAIIFEVLGTVCMKLAAGFTKLVPSILLVVFYAASFAFFTVSLKKIEVSTSYAIWSGLGTAMIAVIGIVYFKESLTVMKVVSIALIIAGVVGINLKCS